MSKNNNSILIFTSDQAKLTSSNGAERGVKDMIKRTTEKAAEITINTLQNNMQQFLSGLDTVIKSSPKEIGGLMLDEIEIHANIDGKGNIGITGIMGAEFATQGGIKFVLRKKI